jgi:hypothetical protein
MSVGDGHNVGQSVHSPAAARVLLLRWGWWTLENHGSRRGGVSGDVCHITRDVQLGVRENE